MPPVLLRLFSTQDTTTTTAAIPPTTQSNLNHNERGEELKQKLGISGKQPLRVAELEKQLLQPSPTSQEPTNSNSNNDILPKPIPITIKVLSQ